MVGLIYTLPDYPALPTQNAQCIVSVYILFSLNYTQEE